jgi:phospholipid/cholesterol/gamma-HCH transport system substrate-binding protein
MSRRTLGAIALAVAFAAAALAVVKPNPFAGGITVRARFADAAGLGIIGADVRMAGTPVGKVTGVRRYGSKAIVTMRLDESAGPIGSDATAEIRPRLAFEGTAYVDLHPGRAGAPPLGDTPLPLGQTSSYVSLDTALRVAQPATRADIRQLTAELDAAVHAPALQGIVRGLPALTEDVGTVAGAVRGHLGVAVNGLDQTAAALAGEHARLVPLLRDVATTAGALDGAALAETIDALPATLADLRTGSAQLQVLLTQLEPFARELRPGLPPLTGAVSAAIPVLRRAAAPLTAARPLIADLATALRAGAAGAPATRAALDALSPTLTTLDRSLLPALAKPTSLGNPAYVAFMNLFAGGGGASKPFQRAGDGPPFVNQGAGHFMRFGVRFITGIGLPAPPCTLVAKLNGNLASTLSRLGVCTP